MGLLAFTEQNGYRIIFTISSIPRETCHFFLRATNTKMEPRFISFLPYFLVVICLFWWTCSALMDCVGCEKCRLWGKLQILGLGTGLKILFSANGDEPSVQQVSSQCQSCILSQHLKWFPTVGIVVHNVSTFFNNVSRPKFWHQKIHMACSTMSVYPHRFGRARRIFNAGNWGLTTSLKKLPKVKWRHYVVTKHGIFMNVTWFSSRDECSRPMISPVRVLQCAVFKFRVKLFLKKLGTFTLVFVFCCMY